MNDEQRNLNAFNKEALTDRIKTKAAYNVHKKNSTESINSQKIHKHDFPHAYPYITESFFIAYFVMSLRYFIDLIS